MSDEWDKMEKAKENSYFAKKTEEALAKLTREEQKPRLSPITNEPLVKKIINGVIVDVCTTSGGIWLDKGELEKLIEIEKNKQNLEQESEDNDGIIGNLLKGILGE